MRLAILQHLSRHKVSWCGGKHSETAFPLPTSLFILFRVWLGRWVFSHHKQNRAPTVFSLWNVCLEAVWKAAQKQAVVYGHLIRCSRWLICQWIALKQNKCNFCISTVLLLQKSTHGSDHITVWVKVRTHERT